MRHLFMIMLVCASMVAGLTGARADVRIAVASNFIEPARDLGAVYTAQTGVDWRISHGASGALSAQIENGAPFDLFLSADTDRPAYLDRNGRALDLATYAVGRLVLVLAAGETAPFPQVVEGLRTAVPDPAVAPYGRASEQVLLGQGFALAGDERIVSGDAVRSTPARPALDVVLAPNVSAAASYFAVGAVDAAFVAASLVPAIAAKRDLRVIAMDQGHSPIRQDMALLTDRPEARAAFEWLQSDAAREIIAQAGYDLPERE